MFHSKRLIDKDPSLNSIIYNRRRDSNESNEKESATDTSLLQHTNNLSRSSKHTGLLLASKSVENGAKKKLNSSHTIARLKQSD